jgi:hypothetical protein
MSKEILEENYQKILNKENFELPKEISLSDQENYVRNKGHTFEIFRGGHNFVDGYHNNITITVTPDNYTFSL